MRSLALLMLLPACVHITDEEAAWRADQDTHDTAPDDDCVEDVWYTDADGDGYGDPTAAVKACEQPDGMVDNFDDCDDDDPDVALERTWYHDADGDGYGGATTTERCGVPDGYTDVTGDCDDADAGAFPGSDETCASPGDDDCDGQTDEDDAIDCSIFYADADGDGYGGLEETCACTAPMNHTDVSGDCDDSTDAMSPGQSEVCGDGLDNDCDGGFSECVLQGDLDLADAELVITGEVDKDNFGQGIAFAGDMQGDGNAYIVVSAKRGGRAASTAGQSYVLPAYGTGEYVASDLAVGILTGEAANDNSGSAIDSAGDVDGDGYPDVVVGAYAEGTGDAGATYLVHGPVVGELSLSEAEVKIAGAGGVDYFGWAVSGGGDLNGDGGPDYIASAYRATEGSATNAGAVYLFYGTVSGTLSSADADVVLVGDVASSRTGQSVDIAGDLDGDGLDDVAIGADRNGAGRAYVVLGGKSDDLALSAADGTINGATYASQAGHYVEGVGDLDGDGLDDLAVGVAGWYQLGVYEAGVYLVPGPATGTISLGDVSNRITGLTPDDPTGTGADGAGDMDADGKADLLVGGPHDGGGGAAYLFYGPVSGDTAVGDANATFTYADEAAVGFAVAGGQDVNGDGVPDLLISANPGQDDSTDGPGAAFVQLGGGL